MWFTPSQLGFIVLFAVSIGALQVGYWIERRIIRRLRILAPEEWHRYAYAFGVMLRTGRLKRRIAMGGLRDVRLAALLKILGRVNAVAMAAFLGCILLMGVFHIGR